MEFALIVQHVECRPRCHQQPHSMPGLLAEAEIDDWASPLALVPFVLLAVAQLVHGPHAGEFGRLSSSCSRTGVKDPPRGGVGPALLVLRDRAAKID